MTESDRMLRMRAPQPRRGRPRSRNREPRVYVGGYVSNETADQFDAICDTRGMSRAAVIQEFVEREVERNQALLVDDDVQEALIAS